MFRKILYLDKIQLFQIPCNVSMARQLQCERLSIGASYSSLFARDLDFPLQSIFLSLDPVSLKNSRLVNKQWNYFIKHRVWGTKKDSEPNSR